VFAVSSFGLAGLLPASLTAQRDPGPMWTQDDEWAAVAKRVPGFAGFWQEGSTLVLALVDTTQQAAALRDIAGQFPVDRYTRVRVQRVAYDFAQLLAWKQLVFEHLGGPREPYSVTSIDADEAHNRVLVRVKDSSGLAPARRTFETLGVPPSALWLEVGEFIMEPGVQALPNPRMQPTGRGRP
jgi:hypothetical protein